MYWEVNVRLKNGQEVYAEAGKMVYKTANVDWDTRMTGQSLGAKILGALQRKFVERIKASTERMGSLMNDMLTEQPLGLTAQQLTQKQQMEAAAQANDYDQASKLVGDVKSKAEAMRAKVYVPNHGFVELLAPDVGRISTANVVLFA